MQVLGLQSLVNHCQVRLGDLTAQLQLYTAEQIRQQNQAGKCWLILDGMVLDVTRWLPEHPGGASIIPNQSLNMDCARFFEIYHASRESFLYMKEFYIGELNPRDRPFVETAGREPCSQEFLQLLRQYTAWRMPTADVSFKSF